MEFTPSSLEYTKAEVSITVMSDMSDREREMVSSLSCSLRASIASVSTAYSPAPPVIKPASANSFTSSPSGSIYAFCAQVRSSVMSVSSASPSCVHLLKEDMLPFKRQFKNSVTTGWERGDSPSVSGSRESRKDMIPSAFPQEEVSRESRFIPVAGMNIKSCIVDMLPSTLTI